MRARIYKYVCIDMYINTCVCIYIHIYHTDSSQVGQQPGAQWRERVGLGG